MSTLLGTLVKSFLLSCGYREEKISKYSGETRLLHDMGVYGDDAKEDCEILQRRFGVDLSTFPLFKYFPSEFGFDSTIIVLLGWTRLGDSIKNKYPPVTLDMLEQTMQAKKWTFD